MVGDALSDYDVGWVNLALDGPDATTTALASVHRLVDLGARVLLPAHGPIPTDPAGALATAVRRAQRLVDDPDGAVWYGARRILAFALMIRDGIPVDEIEPYLHARAWLTDAPDSLAEHPKCSPPNWSTPCSAAAPSSAATTGCTPPPTTPRLRRTCSGFRPPSVARIRTINGGPRSKPAANGLKFGTTAAGGPLTRT